MREPRYGASPSPDFAVAPTADDVDFFRENGFLVVERLTTDEELAWLERIFDHIFDPDRAGRPGAPLDRSGALAEGEPSRLSQAFFPEMAFPEIMDSAFRKNGKRYAAALLGVDAARLSSWGHMIRKPPGGREVSWHQDKAYWQPELDYCALGVWLPLQDVTVEMGAMQFLPGSHKGGLRRHRHLEDPIHNLLAVDEPLDTSGAVACPLKAGGATFHHSETLHFTAPNSTPRERKAFPTEYELAPVRRDRPADMPWMFEHRARIPPQPLSYVADGKLILV